MVHPQLSPSSAPVQPQLSPSSVPVHLQFSPSSSSVQPQFSLSSSPVHPQSSPSSALTHPQLSPSSAPAQPQSIPSPAPVHPSSAQLSPLPPRAEGRWAQPQPWPGCGPDPAAQSAVRVVFHDRRLQYSEQQQLEGWRWSRPGDRILDIGGCRRRAGGRGGWGCWGGRAHPLPADIPLSVGILEPQIHPTLLNTVEFLWDPSRRTSVFVQVGARPGRGLRGGWGGPRGLVGVPGGPLRPPPTPPSPSRFTASAPSSRCGRTGGRKASPSASRSTPLGWGARGTPPSTSTPPAASSRCSRYWGGEGAPVTPGGHPPTPLFLANPALSTGSGCTGGWVHGGVGARGVGARGSGVPVGRRGGGRGAALTAAGAAQGGR